MPSLEFPDYRESAARQRSRLRSVYYVVLVLTAAMVAASLFVTLLDATTRRDVLVDLIRSDVQDIHADIDQLHQELRLQQRSIGRLLERLAAQEVEMEILKARMAASN